MWVGNSIESEPHENIKLFGCLEHGYWLDLQTTRSFQNVEIADNRRLQPCMFSNVRTRVAFGFVPRCLINLQHMSESRLPL